MKLQKYRVAKLQRYIPITLIFIFNALFCQSALKEKINDFILEIEKVRQERFSFLFPKPKPITRKELLAMAEEFVKGDKYLNKVIPIYQKLQFIDKNISLKKIKSLFKKTIVEQITAFYSTNDNRIYFNTRNIIKPLPNFRFAEKIGLSVFESIFIHELIHALDYQNFSKTLTNYTDKNIIKIINEGSAMFSLFLYSANKKGVDTKEFVKEHMRFLPIYYNNTGYKLFDRLPDIIKYDMTLPYSLGARLFYRMYRTNGPESFKKIFSKEYCSLQNLFAYVYNSYSQCFTPALNEILIAGGFKNVKEIKGFSQMHILSMLFSMDTNNQERQLTYKLLPHIKHPAIFQFDKDTVLLILQLKNRKVAGQVFYKFLKKYSCITENKHKSCSIVVGSRINKNKYLEITDNKSGYGHYLAKTNNYVVLLVSNNVRKILNFFKKNFKLLKIKY